MFETSLLLLGLIVLAAFTIEAMVGFGSIIISLTVASALDLYSLGELLPILVGLSLVLVSYMVTRHRGHVAVKLIGFRVLPFMGVGVGVGVALFSVVEGPVFKAAFGIGVVVLALVELWKLFRTAEAKPQPWSWVNNIWIHIAGIIHGIYATGGPLLVYALGRSQLPKSTLRSSLATIWLIMDLILLVTFAIQGRLDLVDMFGNETTTTGPVMVPAKGFITLSQAAYGTSMRYCRGRYPTFMRGTLNAVEANNTNTASSIMLVPDRPGRDCEDQICRLDCDECLAECDEE